MKKVYEHIRLLRPKHWIKNALIAVPAFFGGVIFTFPNWLCLLTGFFTFSFYASSIYIINDLCDIENDRLHPIKCLRPLAKGTVTKGTSVILAIVMILLAFGLSILPNGFSVYMLIPIVFVVLNLLYSLFIKNVPLVDLMILVSGYFLRVLYGSFIIGVPMSNWLYLAIISISFFLALGKRRNEKRSCGKETREVLESYSSFF